MAGGKNIPSWVSEKKRKSLNNDEEYRRRIELIQDFDFPAACQRIKLTSDGQYIFATGYHPPRVRVYDVNQLSMKFERHLDSEIVDFQILTEDYSKAVFLSADRYLNFHARFGAYYKIRVPKFGRDLSYAPFTAELLVAASAPEVYRLNLEEGRFLSPLPTRSSAINCCGISPSHGLFACAGEDGGLECFDLRQKQSLGWLNAANGANASGQGLTALRFDKSGMHVAVGTSGGIVALYDLRSSIPLLTKDHMYDSPIVDIKFHSGGALGGAAADGKLRVISTDRHIIKIWDAMSGEGYTNIEPADGSDINDVAVSGDSGLVMAACDSSRIQAYFIPSLGPAPRWCTFLDSLTEELEENATPVAYDDYRFITRADLNKLGLSHLLGTPLIRAYMHGYFVDNRLYQKAKSIADPFAYEAYRQKRIEEKLEEERRSRISIIKKLPKVNAAMAARLMAHEQDAKLLSKTSIADDEQEIDNVNKSSISKGSLPSLLEDNRFKALFEDPAFAIDERSEEYRLLHPNVDPKKNEIDELLNEHFEQLGSDQSDEEKSSDGGDSVDSEDDDTVVRSAQGRTLKRSKKLRPENGVDRSAPGRRSGPRLFVAKDVASANAFREGKSLRAEKELPLGVRSRGAHSRSRQHRAGGASASHRRGNRELHFQPRLPFDKFKRGRRPPRGRGRRQ